MRRRGRIRTFGVHRARLLIFYWIGSTCERWNRWYSFGNTNPLSSASGSVVSCPVDTLIHVIPEREECSPLRTWKPHSFHPWKVRASRYGIPSKPCAFICARTKRNPVADTLNPWISMIASACLFSSSLIDLAAFHLLRSPAKYAAFSSLLNCFFMVCALWLWVNSRQEREDANSMPLCIIHKIALFYKVFKGWNQR